MPILKATDPAFIARYSRRARVFDHSGREIPFVCSTDSLTGEALVCPVDPLTGGVFLLRCLTSAAPVIRHCWFFPAPLQVVPNSPF